MIFLGHAGIPLYAVQKIVGRERFGAHEFWAVAFCSLLPDLIDKPLYVLGIAPIPIGRLWGHTLLFTILWCLVCRFWLKSLWPWALATPAHLLLDAMWTWPRTLVWPLAGLAFDRPEQIFPSAWDSILWLIKVDPLEFTVFMILPEFIGAWLIWLVLRPADLRAELKANILFWQNKPCVSQAAQRPRT